MSATGIIFLILFLIAIGVAIHYCMLCFQGTPDTPRKYRSVAHGPLLDEEQSMDTAPEEEALVAPVRSSLDEPDSSKLDDDSLNEGEATGTNYENELKTSIIYQVTPECAKKECVFLAIEDEDSASNSSKPVVPDVRRDLKPAFLASASAPSFIVKPNAFILQNQPLPPRPDTLSNSYEEDGLRVTRKVPSESSNLIDATDNVVINLQMHESAAETSPPKKHVQFKNPVQCAAPNNSNVIVLEKQQKTPMSTNRIESNMDTPYPTSPAHPTVCEGIATSHVVKPVYEKISSPPTKIGWIESGTPEPQLEEKPLLVPEIEKRTPDEVVATARVSFPSDESISDRIHSQSSNPSDDCETSDPEVTEYSFQTGPMVPSTGTVLADEMGSYSDPKITSFVPLVDSEEFKNEDDCGVNNRPCTPNSMTDGRSISPASDTSIEIDVQEGTENKLIDQNVLGTPPITPPQEKISSGFVIMNPCAKLEANSASPAALVTNNRPRAGSASSTGSCSSVSSSSSSSTNGSYKIQNVEEKSDTKTQSSISVKLKKSM